jgi:undecaprenyl diphosphate synthase
LAIIADGNRRWAKERGLPIKVGYSQGLIVIENCCEWALKEKVKYLTFYCLSTENWRRSEAEISLLQEMGANYFDN